MSIKYYATEEYVVNKFAGCEIRFEDEDGNPTTEPFIHWDEEETEVE